MENLLNLNPERRFKTSTFIEAVVGVLAVALTILALVNVLPTVLISLAVIAVGVDFLLEGIALWTKDSILIERVKKGKQETPEGSGGVTAEFIGGVGGIVLGVLSLIGVATNIMLSVAVIGYGLTLTLSSGEISYFRPGKHFGNEIGEYTIISMSGLQMLVGLGVIFAGMVSLTGVPELALIISAIAMLVISAIELLKSAALSAMPGKVFRKED